MRLIRRTLVKSLPKHFFSLRIHFAAPSSRREGEKKGKTCVGERSTAVLWHDGWSQFKFFLLFIYGYAARSHTLALALRCDKAGEDEWRSVSS